MGAGLNLDEWVPLASTAVRTRHRRAADVDPEVLWRAASAVRLADARTLGRVVRWRIPGTPPDISFREVFRREPFCLLAEGPTWSLSGLCGRIWKVHRAFGRLEGPEDFRSWQRPGTVRVLFAHWTQPVEDGRAELHSEARVAPVDRVAAVRTRAVWAILGPFERLIGPEVLAAAARRAGDDPRQGERRGSRAGTGG